ncbi:MAG: hypothetical protein WBH09_11625 [Rugosibacter sp.]
MGLIALIKNNVVIIAAHAARFSACFRQDAQRLKLSTEKFPSYLVLLFSTFHETCRATTRHVSRYFPGILPLTALRLLTKVTCQAGLLSQFNTFLRCPYHFSQSKAAVYYAQFPKAISYHGRRHYKHFGALSGRFQEAKFRFHGVSPAPTFTYFE